MDRLSFRIEVLELGVYLEQIRKMHPSISGCTCTGKQLPIQPLEQVQSSRCIVGSNTIPTSCLLFSSMQHTKLCQCYNVLCSSPPFFFLKSQKHCSHFAAQVKFRLRKILSRQELTLHSWQLNSATGLGPYRVDQD